MLRRLAISLTLVLLGTGSAAAQNGAAVVQQIHDGAYAQCMQKARFGAGAELQENCSCSADVVVDLLSDEFKQAIAGGTQARFKGAKLKGDEKSFNAALLQACPKLRPYL